MRSLCCFKEMNMAYIVHLQGSRIQHIRVYRANILLAKTNLRARPCSDCARRLAADEGIYRRAYQKNGFLCQDCLAKFLQISTHIIGGDGDAGFRLDPEFSWLIACWLGPRQFTTAEVIQAIKRRPREQHARG